MKQREGVSELVDLGPSASVHSGAGYRYPENESMGMVAGAR